MNRSLIAAGLIAGGMLQSFAQTNGSAVPLAPTIQTTATIDKTGTEKSKKEDGIVKIGLIHPSVQMTSGATATEPLEKLVASYLSSPHAQIVTINARLAQQIQDELKQQGCDLALSISLIEKKNGNGLALLKGASSMASMIPMVGMAGGLAGMAASAAAGTALSSAGALAGTVKAKSEYTVKYSLVRTADQQVVKANAMQAKAKHDGDDVITPAVEQMATEVLAQAANFVKVQP